MENTLCNFIDACPVCSAKNTKFLIRDIALTYDPKHPEKGAFCENCGTIFHFIFSQHKNQPERSDRLYCLCVRPAWA